MDPITQELTSLILKTDVARRPDLAEAGRRAFADYLASALAGSREEAVRRTAAFLATRKGERDILGFDVRTTPENAAFFNGFASHYLDFDDAEANLMGHFSTVIFSALLAIADPSDTFEDFLAGYTAGAETEGLLGKLVNPAHKKRGYHPTATIGPIGAAAAIARFRRLPLKEASELLSLGATESAGLGLEAGTDTKPLHSGFAARNAVFSYFLIRDCALTSSTSAFNNDDGWAAVTAGKTIAEGALSKRWLSPGELISPGLWMKKHQYLLRRRHPRRRRTESPLEERRHTGYHFQSDLPLPARQELLAPLPCAEDRPAGPFLDGIRRLADPHEGRRR